MACWKLKVPTSTAMPSACLQTVLFFQRKMSLNPSYSHAEYQLRVNAGIGAVSLAPEIHSLVFLLSIFLSILHDTMVFLTCHGPLFGSMRE